MDKTHTRAHIPGKATRKTTKYREKSSVGVIRRTEEISWSYVSTQWSRCAVEGTERGTHRLRWSATTSSSRRPRAAECRPCQRKRITRALSPAAPADWVADSAPPRAIDAAPHAHAPSGPTPPLPHTSPHLTPRPFSEFPRRARALPSFLADRWPPLIDWARSFAERILGQHRRRASAQCLSSYPRQFPVLVIPKLMIMPTWAKRIMQALIPDASGSVKQKQQLSFSMGTLF